MTKPKVYINEGIEVLSSILEKERAKRIFIVTSGNSSYVAIREKIEKLLLKTEYFLFSDFTSNPELNEIKRGIAEFDAFSGDLILSIGGGTAIDIAKSINILSTQTNNLEDVVKDSILIEHKVAAPLVVMPTTAGTGSEATHFSVIYIDKKKYSLAHKTMLPNYVILDECLVRTMPKYIAACTTFDALSQSVESFISRSATSESKAIAIESVEIILNNITIPIDKNNIQQRKAMVYAAYLSGCAINITKTAAPHAISYTLTSHYNIAHGHAVAMLLAATIKISYSLCDENTRLMFLEIFKLFECTTIDDFYNTWYQHMIKLGLTTKLSQNGLAIKDLDNIVAGVNLERLGNHPVNLNANDIAEIVNNVF